MPRKPRIHYPGAVYHVMLRGNGGQDIFFDSSDRSRFLFLVQQGVVRYHHRVHAYCLMDNHVHLALQAADIPLSKIMQNMSFRYTQYLNRKRNTTGHVFQGRFKALLIDADNYLLALVRYIHLNPIRAGMVSDLNDHPWSSHGCYEGKQITPWLTVDWVLSQWGKDCAKARQQYRRFIQEGLGEGHLKKFHRGTFEGRILGDDRFIENALLLAEQESSKPMSMSAILDCVCEFYGVKIEDLASPGRQQPVAEARAAAAWLVWQSDNLQLKELGTKLNRDLSGLSQAARRFDLRMRGDSCLSSKIECLKQKL